MACFCAHGWVCEEHPDQPMEHTTPATHETQDGRTLAYQEICSGPGTHCLNPECNFGRANLKRQEVDAAINRKWYPNGFPQPGRGH